MPIRKRDISLTLAVSASLLAHGLVVCYAVHERVSDLLSELAGYAHSTYASRAAAQHITLASAPRSNLLVPLAETPSANPDTIVEPPDTLQPLPKPQPLPPPIPPAPTPLPDIGDHTGGGNSSARSPGEKPHQARESDVTQANLGVQPQGARHSGAGGTGGTPGTPNASPSKPSPASPEHPKVTADATPPAPTPPTPKPLTPDDQQPAANQGADGIFKGNSSPTPTTPPPPAQPKPPAPATPDAAKPRPPSPPAQTPAPTPAPTPEEKRRALEAARQADLLRQSPGKTQTDKPSPENGPTPTPDPRNPLAKPAEKDETRRNTTGESKNAGGKPQDPGTGPAAPPGGNPKPREDTRPRTISPDPTSPKGAPDSKTDRDQKGQPNTPTPPKPTDPTPPTDRQPPDSPKPPDTKPPAAKPPEPKPADIKPAEPKPAETKPAEAKPAETKPPEPKPSEKLTAGTQSAAEKPADTDATSTAKPAPPQPQTAPPQPAPQNPSQSSQPHPPGSTGGAGDGRAPGTPAPPGDPAPQSDSESDAFDKTGSVQFANGRVDARFGRKVKWVRPRLTLAGQLDAATIARSSVVLSVNTDANGNVTKVDVLQSSGSPDSIDLPIVRAVYAWWIEPPKNRAGQTIPDTMVWRIELK